MTKYLYQTIIALTAFTINLLVSYDALAQQLTQVGRLQQFANQKRLEWQNNKSAADSLALQLQLPLRQEYPDGTIIEVVKIAFGMPLYYITHNANAAITTRVNHLWPGGKLGLSLTGSGYNKLGEWDGAGVRTTHQEFDGRVTQMDSPSGLSHHSTHVAGTMVAGGVEANAIGMAYQANLQTYEWTSDKSEMASAAASGMEISNHSYGFITGWRYDSGSGLWWWYGNTSIDSNEDYKFGYYDSEARDWDQIAYNAPNYLIVKSVGNDRGDWYNAIHYHAEDGLPHNDTHEADGGTNGYDCISSMSGAKNILTVGAANDVLNYSGPPDVEISSFSGWGPTDDGRIKPDIVANGVELYSSFAGSNTHYGIYSGTSMSTPNASGTLALLQQHYQNTHSGSPMRSATLKALVLHTTDECGANPGPDYEFGWGLLNAERSVRVISEDLQQNVIDERTLSNGGSYQRSITVVGDDPAPLRVTIAWTDPAGSPVAVQLDPTDLMLVNDLNLTITRDASTYYPWTLDPGNPAAAAVQNNPNIRDNVEQVYIANPQAGTYNITVDHTGSLSGGTQQFSLIISGIDAFASVPASCSGDLISPEDGATNVPLTSIITWEPVIDASSYDLYFGTDGGGISTPSNIVSGDNQGCTTYAPELSPNTTYYAQVIPRNSQGVNSSCTTIWSFSTESASAISTFPYSEDFESFTIGTGNDWQNAADDDFDWQELIGPTGSSGTGPSGDHTSGSGQYLYTEASSPNYPYRSAHLLTPLFDLSSLNNPTLEFWYHMYADEGDGQQSMGDLHVDIYGDGSWHNSVVYISGNQGSQWQAATVDLSPYKNTAVCQIRFRAITGQSYKSDIAIDDFLIYPESYFTFRSGSTAPREFANTDVTIQFTTPNSSDLSIGVIKNTGDPGIVPPLPGGVQHVSPERYWSITVESGSVDGTYTMTIDLTAMGGINDYSTLMLLKRANSSSSWQVQGTNAYGGSGTLVSWTNISSGFSDFAIGGGGDNSLPVTLTLFNATLQEGSVLLKWHTESEIENVGFIIQRREKGNEDWTEIASYLSHDQLLGQGNASNRSDYQYVDVAVQPGITYQYRLADLSYDGELTFHEIVEIEVTASDIPRDFVLNEAYPNPFNPVTTISYGLPETVEVKILVYDILGRKVKTLLDKTQTAGWHNIRWNGTNSFGNQVGSGLYMYTLQSKSCIIVKKVVLLR
jgi:hypothetical protein